VQLDRAKTLLASCLDGVGATRLGLALQRLRLPCVRVVNYHDVPPSQRDSFEAHLALYRELFCDVRPEDLFALAEGRWDSDRPGLVITFDDGVRSHGEIAAPLLERYGFTGWFFIPVGFVAAPDEEQRSFAERHRIQYESDEYSEERIALSWDEIRALDGRHVIGCHGWSHERLSDDVEDPRREVIDSKRRLEDQLGHNVDSFCWVGGEDWSYGRAAAALVRESYAMSFTSTSRPLRSGCNLGWIDRTHIEACYPIPLVRLLLSGAADLWHAPRRARIRDRIGT
jgi:peptidoglycan/xylan/chitin deacetylase (PgdA/CDA1 family)